MTLAIWTCGDKPLCVLVYCRPPRSRFEYIDKISIRKMTVLIMHLLHEVSAKLEVDVWRYYPLLHLSEKYSVVMHKFTDLCHYLGPVRLICIRWKHSIFQKLTNIEDIILCILQYQCIEVGTSTDCIWNSCLATRAILDHQIVLLELIDPFCESFGRFLHCIHVLQRVVIRDHGNRHSILNVMVPFRQGILNREQFFLMRGIP